MRRIQSTQEISTIRTIRTHRIPVNVVVAVLALVAWIGPVRFAAAQSKKEAARLQTLDKRASQAVEDFSEQAYEIAQEYEDAGQYQKAKAMLEAIITVRPELEDGLKKRIRQLNESVMSANEFEVELTPGVKWQGPVARAVKGRAFRIQASGTYSVSMKQTLGPAGLSQEKPLQGGMMDAPFGSLVGVFIPVDKKKADEAEPFVIGPGKDYTPAANGQLFLRINVPQGSKCTGTLKLKFSGYVGKS